MTYPNPTHDPAVRTELMDHVASLYDRARTVLGQQCEATPSGVVNWYAEGLRKPAEGTWTEGSQVHAAREIVTSLLDSGITQRPEFWATALGRAVSWHIGYHDADAVPRDVIAALLGVSKQAVWAMVQRHVGRGNPAFFTAGEVRDLLRSRWRQDVAA